ncbi:MAG: DUF4338 domain-containing protein, partial [Acidobacteriota bacterium]|nr:DUF4338 domain-containing protein [Acidobacteriota bacterium]
MRALAEVRRAFQQRAESLDPAISPEVSLAVSVLCDLRGQGWSFEVEAEYLVALKPTRATDAGDRKGQVRTAHLIERNAQLEQPAVRRFVRSMEHRRLFRNAWHSIFSLMRDGEDLARLLREAAAVESESEQVRRLEAVIDPYVELVEVDSKCAFTGFRLVDVWRYFRHTWTTTYNSTPGRSMLFLIRDRAAANHPVIGIGALGSSIVQLGRRDEWIGWTSDALLKQLRAHPTKTNARWLFSSIDRLISGIRNDDLLRSARISSASLAAPSSMHIERLRAIARKNRERHRLYPEKASHKSVIDNRDINWTKRSETYLFRAKRAEQLAQLLEARHCLLAAGFQRATASCLARAIADKSGAKAIQSVLRGIKASAVGVHMMDITVCGAVAPYNALLGGKLVALLMASPDVTNAYNARYARSASVIASSMAGRIVRRKPKLVLLGTTSLYD